MREGQQMCGGLGAEDSSAGGASRLVVVAPLLGPIARTNFWIRHVVDGQELIAIPRLHVEQHAALAITSGVGLGKLFKDCRIVSPEWEDIAGFVGGNWQLWKTSRSELLNVGFVKGSYSFNIELAVRGIKNLLT